MDSFKRRLDRYLNTVPDEPQIPGYTAMRRTESNSLLEMTRLATASMPGDRASLVGVVNDIAVDVQ